MVAGGVVVNSLIVIPLAWHSTQEQREPQYCVAGALLPELVHLDKAVTLLRWESQAQCHTEGTAVVTALTAAAAAAGNSGLHSPGRSLRLGAQEAAV